MEKEAQMMELVKNPKSTRIKGNTPSSEIQNLFFYYLVNYV